MFVRNAVMRSKQDNCRLSTLQTCCHYAPTLKLDDIEWTFVSDSDTRH